MSEQTSEPFVNPFAPFTSLTGELNGTAEAEVIPGPGLTTEGE